MYRNQISDQFYLLYTVHLIWSDFVKSRILCWAENVNWMGNENPCIEF